MFCAGNARDGDRCWRDYGDIYADNDGGVLMVSRDAQGGGTLNCGVPADLCGTAPTPAIPCYDMYLVRFVSQDSCVNIHQGDGLSAAAKRGWICCFRSRTAPPRRPRTHS